MPKTMSSTAFKKLHDHYESQMEDTTFVITAEKQ